MDAERWRRIDDLYQSVREREPEQRIMFLAEACKGDEDLRRQVEALLSQSGSTQDLVGRPVWEVVAALAEKAGGLTASTRFGPYEIVGPLGEGGMGRVYRAVDTRLGRPVAIKISAEQFSSRFDREARAISALNHPHICTLYDVGPNYLVMELVEGETLAQRIDRLGPLPLQDVLEIGVQVAEALEAAHRKGIIHRDLKPANIKITPEGRAKVLDFGLAKSVRHERAEEKISQVTVASAVASSTGQLLGTPAYMSPEQGRGEEVDQRTDIWAFGCLIYELLTGKRAFGGASSSEVITCVLERDPDWQALPRTTPANIRALLRQCLRKDPIRRLQDIHAARTQIERTRRPTRRARANKPVLVTTLVIAIGLASWFLRGGGPRSSQMVHAVPLTTYPGSQDWPSFSPDGTRVAFSWDGEKQDNFDIYVKRIGPEPPLRITDNPAEDTGPAWSPDGRSIAFLRSSRPGKAFVALAPPAGGPERIVGEVIRFDPLNKALTWSPDSKWLVVFDQPANELPGLWLLSVETGERRRLTTILAESANSGDFSPAFSPDGRFLAYKRLVDRNSYDLYLLPLAADMHPRGEPRRLTRDGQVIMGLGWTPDARELIFSSGSPGNLSLFRTGISGAAPKRLTEEGEILNLTVSPRSKRVVFTRSRREMDIYRIELSGSGTEARDAIPLIASSRLERYPSYSPDGKKIAFVSLRSGNWQLWVCDSDGEHAIQMTSFTRGEAAFPTWSPDGSQVGFISNAEGSQQAYAVDAAGGRLRKLTALGMDVLGFRWSRKGDWIFFGSARGGAHQLWKTPAAGGALEQLTLEGGGGGITVESPDGKLVYYVRPGGIWCVPVEGGPERQVFAANIDPGTLDADQRGIYFLANSAVAKNGDLMFYRFPNGPITKVAGVELRYGLSLSPDGRYLAYTKTTATGSDLMLVENFR